MAYTLKLTNGKILLTLPDQTSDSVSTSLTLIGKNVNAYGTDINQNYIRILENFANTTAPTAPLQGQLWYDTVSQQVKVYTFNNEFKPVGTPVISSTAPATLGVGDLWYDTTAEQLKFQKDASTLVVIGPQYDATVGKSGWVTETYPTSLNLTATAVSLYSNDVLLGILSDTAFTINSAVTSTSLRSIGVGFNAEYRQGVQTKFYGTATSAESLTDTNGNTVTVEQIITDNAPVEFLNPVTVYNNLTIGTNPSAFVYTEDFQFYVEGASTAATLFIGGQDEDFNIKVNTTVTNIPAVHVDAKNARVGIFTNNPESTFSVGGDVTIDGNLRVLGTSTYAYSQDLRITDKNIELAFTTTALTTSSDGGGIILKNYPLDSSILWYNASPAGGRQVWSFTDNVELQSPVASYIINGYEVLTRNALGVAVTSAPGLTSIGNLSSATIGILRITQQEPNHTTIGIDTTIANTGTIVIGDSNTTNIDFAGRPIWNVPQPLVSYGATLYKSSVPNVEWVLGQIDNALAANKIVSLTIDVTGQATGPEDPALDAFVIQYLTYMLDPNAPAPYDTPVDTIARVLCTRYTTPPLPAVPSNFLEPGLPLFVDKAGVEESASVIQWSQFLRVTTDLPAANLGINRAVKQYFVTGDPITPGNRIWARLVYTGTTNTVHDDGTWI